MRPATAACDRAGRGLPILILDEPTIGLHEENERAVVAALDWLAEGRTTFLITHQLHLVAGADQILFLDGGRVAEQATHA